MSEQSLEPYSPYIFAGTIRIVANEYRRRLVNCDCYLGILGPAERQEGLMCLD